MEPPAPAVFVLGATGYVGRAVVEAAARMEDVARVVAHARPGSSSASRLEPLAGGKVTVERCPLEPAALRAALEAAAPGVAVRYEVGAAEELAGERSFDHLGCISVFTDPERWPGLSGVSYGRMPPVQLDVDAFVAERDAARSLAASVFGRLARPGCITTSAEEVSWFLELCEAQQLEVDPSEDLIETAVVGDPVGFLRVAGS